MTTLETQVESALRAEMQQVEARVAAVERCLEDIGARMAAVERGVQALAQRANTLQDGVAADLHEFDQTLQAHAGIVESARDALAQTDDMVERVVEALESLQTSVFDPSAGRLAGVN